MRFKMTLERRGRSKPIQAELETKSIVEAAGYVSEFVLPCGYSSATLVGPNGEQAFVSTSEGGAK